LFVARIFFGELDNRLFDKFNRIFGKTDLLHKFSPPLFSFYTNWAGSQEPIFDGFAKSPSAALRGNFVFGRACRGDS
jgi:hypothetical protein